jgi:sugar phosphate isomerase/epimerase
VRGDCAKDFDAALAAVAKMGFDGVEFAGYHKYDGKPAELRAKLDELGLKAAATHIGTGNLRGDALQKAIDFHQAIGCKFLIVPSDGDFTKPDKSEALAEVFNEAAAKLKPLGMACGYHNHAGEFAKVGDTNHWELFAQRTSKDVILQIDFGWAAVAGQDCPDLVKRHAGRTRVVHLKPTVVNKEAGKKAIFGSDSVNWGPIIAACREFGGTEWFTLEQEVYPDGKSPMEHHRPVLRGTQESPLIDAAAAFVIPDAKDAVAGGPKKVHFSEKHFDSCGVTPRIIGIFVKS